MFVFIVSAVFGLTLLDCRCSIIVHSLFITPNIQWARGSSDLYNGTTIKHENLYVSMSPLKDEEQKVIQMLLMWWRNVSVKSEENVISIS